MSVWARSGGVGGCAILVAAAVTAAPAAAASSGGTDSGAKLVSVTANGPGCDKDSVVATITKDGRAVSVTFADYQVGRNWEQQKLKLSANCTVTVGIDVSDNVQFALWRVTTRGYTSIPRGAKASWTVGYYYNGLPEPDPVEYGDQIRADGSWRSFFTDYVVREDELSWSRCGQTRYLNVASRLSVADVAPAATAYLQMAKNEVEPAVLEVHTRPCGESKGRSDEATRV
ncbi:DUF4360 domain-containing protein [Pilimelia terevasa]|nr:DUF4360 domain-containing protein [Pilimelia terevasa]